MRDISSGALTAIGMALALGCLVGMVSIPVSAVVVTFPDPGLEAAIRDAIGEPTGDIHDADLIGLTSLDARFRGIRDLEGVQYCVDLTELKLYGNEIININALSGLTNLTVLFLDNNQIINISALSDLINLKILMLGNNEIADISALSGLTNLTALFLGKNQIIDISALSSLSNLTGLDLVDNKIVDIRTLSGLTHLTGLGLGDNEIVDIRALSGLANLTKIWLHDNQICDIQALVDNAGLNTGDSVDIRNNALNLTPGSRDILNIETLQGRGVLVDFNPQNPHQTVDSGILINWGLLGILGAILVALLVFANSW